MEPEYMRYVSRQVLDKALHHFEGMLAGIAIDEKLSDEEVAAAKVWLEEYSNFLNRSPFNEVYWTLQEMLGAGSLSEEQKEDVLWLCQNFKPGNLYYQQLTADIQKLHGLLAGIIADRQITLGEVQGLRAWMDEHEELKGAWPYDEVDAVLLQVLADGQVDDEEERFLMQLFKDICGAGESIDSPGMISTTLSGICSACPQIEFTGKYFCFTGNSKRANRTKMQNQAELLGAVCKRGVTKDLDFLVVSDQANPAWAYAAYGRKVEKAVQLRKQGLPLMIVHESDFWDAVEDQL